MNAAAKPEDLEKTIKIYQETLGLLRHYSSLRFAGLSAVLLINFSALALAARLNLQSQYISSIALISTALLYVFERRTNRHIGVLKGYAVKIEERIGLGALSQMPKEGFFSGWMSISVLYFILISSNLISIVFPAVLNQAPSE